MKITTTSKALLGQPVIIKDLYGKKNVDAIVTGILISSEGMLYTYICKFTKGICKVEEMIHPSNIITSNEYYMEFTINGDEKYINGIHINEKGYDVMHSEDYPESSPRFTVTNFGLELIKK